MRRFLVALQFLTIFPVKIKSEIEGKDFGASLLYFPIVGLIVGLLLSLIALSLFFLPALVRAAAILTISILITGGIHLDGFADTCDGSYGNKQVEKVLEIMRESRIGAMGAIGIVSLLLLKFSVMASLQETYLWKTLIVMAVFSRWSQCFACNAACYARKAGKAKYFIEHSDRMASLQETYLWKTLIVMAVFSRWSQCFACNAACYARKAGKAKYFIEH